MHHGAVIFKSGNISYNSKEMKSWKTVKAPLPPAEEICYDSSRICCALFWLFCLHQLEWHDPSSLSLLGRRHVWTPPRLRSWAFDVARLECVIDVEIHVTHFQHLISERHTASASFHLQTGRSDPVARGCSSSEGQCFTCRETDAWTRALALVNNCTTCWWERLLRWRLFILTFAGRVGTYVVSSLQ